MHARSVYFSILALAGTIIAFTPSTSAQAPPFSYRGVYETTIQGGTRVVFFVSKDGLGEFGLLNTASQVASSATFSVSPNGFTSFSTTVGTVSATFTATGVSGNIGGSPFIANRTVLNSVQGSLQGGYSGPLWFQSDGSYNFVEFVLTPAGTFYALADTVTGLQGAIGTYSANGTFSGISVPGQFSINGSATLTDGVFSGSYVIGGTQTVYFDATKENLTYRLINISTRGNVGTGANQMIAGFVIRNGAKRVLIRVLGPSLASQGVTGSLADPLVTLYLGATPIATNDNWQVGNDVAAINATGFAPSDSRECVLLVSLEEGAYTAIVSGVGGTTGVALVEVNEID